MRHDVMFIRRVRPIHLPCLSLEFRIVEIDIRGTEGRHWNASCRMRDRLRWIDHFPGDIGVSWNQSFDHGVQWFSGFTVPEIEEAILAGGADASYGLPVTSNVK